MDSDLTTHLPAPQQQELPLSKCDVIFNSNQIYLAQITGSRLEELKKTVSPQVLKDLEEQAGTFTTDLRRILLELESRLNWLSKTKQIFSHEPDPKMLIDLDTMTIQPRPKRHLSRSKDSWLFRWSSPKILSAIGIDTTVRRDVNPDQILYNLYQHIFLNISPNELTHELRLNALNRIIPELANPLTDTNEDANYFVLMPWYIEKIHHSRAGMMFKSNLLAKLQDRQLELLQLILYYIDAGRTPSWAPEVWKRLFYQGSKPLDKVFWSGFKNDFFERVFPRLENVFKLKLDLMEDKASRRKKKVASAWIKITELDSLFGQPVFLRENETMITTAPSGETVVNLGIDDYSVDKPSLEEHAPATKKYQERKPAKKNQIPKVPFSPELIGQEQVNELTAFNPELNDITTNTLTLFLNAKDNDFYAHFEGQEKTEKQWQRLWINYAKRGWHLERDMYLKYTFQKAMEVIDFMGPNLHWLTKMLHGNSESAKFLISGEFDNFGSHNAGKTFDKSTWLNHFESWLRRSKTVQETIMIYSSKNIAG